MSKLFDLTKVKYGSKFQWKVTMPYGVETFWTKKAALEFQEKAQENHAKKNSNPIPPQVNLNLANDKNLIIIIQQLTGVMRTKLKYEVINGYANENIPILMKEIEKRLKQINEDFSDLSKAMNKHISL
jgi:hypothetical protein